MTAPTKVPSILSEEHFSKLPEGFFVRGVCIPESHGWTAVVLEFDIAGGGETPTEAICQAIELVDDYLFTCFEEGQSFEQALRPAPERFERLYRDSMEGTFDTERPLPRARRPRPRGAARAQAFRQPLPV